MLACDDDEDEATTDEEGDDDYGSYLFVSFYSLVEQLILPAGRMPVGFRLLKGRF